MFTTPDPERVDGVVTATKPLFASGTTVTGLRVAFEHGRVRSIEADSGAEVLRALTARDDGAADSASSHWSTARGGSGRSARSSTTRCSTRTPPSHIALGAGYQAAIAADVDRPRVNVSAIHIDFMIGSRRDLGRRPAAATGPWCRCCATHAWQI